MQRNQRLASLFKHLAVCLILLLWMGSCAGGGCEGCGGLGNPNYKFPREKAINGVVEVRITQPGFDFISEYLKTFIGIFFKVDANGVATIALSDLGLGNIDVLDFGLVSASLRDLVVTIDFTKLKIDLVPNSSPAQIRVRIDNASVGLKDGIAAVEFLFGLGDAGCKLSNGIDVGLPTARITKLSADIILTLAVDSQKRMQVSTKTQNIDLQDLGVSIGVDCNVSECLDGNSQGSTSECGECKTLCPLADFGADIVSGLQSVLKSQINTLLNTFGDWLITQFLDNTINNQPLEIEGELNLGAFLAGFLPSAKRALPLGFLISPSKNGIVVNGTGDNLGLDLKLDGGVDSANLSSCIPTLDSDPQFTAGDPPSFDGEETDAQGNLFKYHFGVGVSSGFLNQAVWAAYKSGLLCLSLSTDDIHRISEGAITLTAAAFDLILPGFRQISSAKAPLLVEIHPRLKASEFPVLTLQPGNEMLLLKMKNSGISLFTTVENRTARVFQVNADIELSLGLSVNPDGSIEVNLGTIKVENIFEEYNELFKGADLEAIIEFVLDLATSYLLKNGLQFDLNLDDIASAVLGLPFSVDIHEIDVAGPLKDWLAVFISLKPATNGSGLTFSGKTTVRVSDSSNLFRIDALGRHRPTGQLELAVDVEGARLDQVEFQYRINNGMWHVWQDGPTLQVSSGRLNLQGLHTIDVRHRMKGQSRYLEQNPAQIKVWVDALPPVVSLRTGEEQIEIVAEDSVCPDKLLRYRYRTDGGDWSPWSSESWVDLHRLPNGARRLTIHVSDAAGNIVERQLALSIEIVEPSSGGCQQGAPQGSSNGWFGLLLLMLFAIVRRYRWLKL